MPKTPSPARRAPRTLAATSALALGLSACSTAAVTATTHPSPNPAPGSSPTSPAAPFLTALQPARTVGTTVPANGDLNPYGLAVVPASMGRLVAGDVLVSNFNAHSNVQGTGTTLVEVSPGGTTRLFADLSRLPARLACPGGVGLTTALGILPGGWVVVGSLPTGPGGVLPGLDPAGCLVVLDSSGTPVETFTNPDLVGPWDLVVEAGPGQASIFVSNALGGNTATSRGVPVAGNCTVVRLDLALSAAAPPRLTATTVIGTGFPWVANKAALVLAPTGLALAPNGTLFVDDAETNRISAIAQATTRTTAVAGGGRTVSVRGALDAPLGMVLTPGGDLVVVNGNDGNAVEVSQAGEQVGRHSLVPNGAGDLFGVALATGGNGLWFANDGPNTLELAPAT